MTLPSGPSNQRQRWSDTAHSILEEYNCEEFVDPEEVVGGTYQHRFMLVYTNDADNVVGVDFNDDLHYLLGVGARAMVGPDQLQAEALFDLETEEELAFETVVELRLVTP